MKKGIVFLTVVCVLLAFAFLVSSGEIAKVAQGAKDKASAIQVQYAPDRLLVKYKDDPQGMFAAQARGQVEYTYSLKQVKQFDRIGVHVYQTSGPMERTWRELKKNPNIAYAEPDYIQKADITIPNDPSFSQLWGMHNTGQTGGTADADIDAPEAWDLVTGNSNVIVGVIDTGVAYTHPDLSANMWTNLGEVPGNGLDDDANGYIDDVYGINSITGTGNPMDDNNHGTHCSGTIAGVGNNGVGVAGVCWTAKIMALKFLDSAGSGYNSDAIECINYAIAKGANILSNSWGGYGYGQSLKDAIDAAGAAGILFVAAAGNDYGHDNDGSQPHYPSSYTSTNIIAVASTTHTDALSSFSNIGAYSVDVAAPGSSIYSTITGDTYASFSGTSMATPHVAGLAALIKSYNFSLNWMQIKNRILSGAEPKASLSGLVLTGARINAYNSLVMSDVASYQMNVQSTPTAGVSITVSPADLDGYSSGTTNFTRRYAPYASMTLTAPETHLGTNFGYWTLEGSLYSDELSISLPVDFNHTAVANYLLPLPEAIDNTSLSVVTFGAQGGWMGQISTYHSGNDAAQSRDADDLGLGTMQTSVRGPGDLTFYWKVSSESGFDYLTFYVDGVPQNSISGEVDWQQAAYSLGAGLHVLQWTYSKDGSVSAGSDCGWVDTVQFSGIPATLGQAMDQEGLVWATGEYGGWFPQAPIYYYDTDAVQSSDLQDGEQTVLATTVAGPTPLSFYWKVSSESNYDHLLFYIDGALQNYISGDVDWQQMNYSLGSGSHVLTWIYSKDGSLSYGSDCGWVDRIVVTPSGWYTLTLQAATAGGGSGGTTDPVPDTYSYPPGQNVSVSAIAYTNYEFTGWTGDIPLGHAQDNPLTLVMTMSRTATANFSSTSGAKDDFVGTWDGQGVYYRNSDTAAWVKLASPATMLACGDLDGDGIDDLIGLWPTQGGIWVKYSQSGAWSKLSSTAVHIAAGDMNGDGRDDLLGTWDGQGVFYRNSISGLWVKLASPATLITTGDLDGDGTDDLVGIWPSQGGVWVKYSQSGAWARLSSTARDIAVGDMNGDGRDDLLATWDGQGVYYRDSMTGGWVKMASEATQVTCGDLDADAKSDLIGIWPTQGGVWVKYAASGTWVRLGSTASDISAGKMRASGPPSPAQPAEAVAAQQAALELSLPIGGFAEGPGGATQERDLSDNGPGGKGFVPREERNLVPAGKRGAAVASVSGPGEPGFKCVEQNNLLPQDMPKREKKAAPDKKIRKK
jgi:subtilisin family serine protease